MPTAKALKLKENLATNVQKILTIKKRAGKYPATDYNTKQPIEGSFIHLYIFHDETGQEFQYYASDMENSTLEDYQDGEKVAVVRIEKVKEDGKRIYFQQWGSPGSAEMTSAPQLKSTSSVVQQGREKKSFEESEANKWDKIALSKIVHEFMKVSLASGHDVDKSIELANLFTRAQYKLVEELWAEQISKELDSK